MAILKSKQPKAQLVITAIGRTRVSVTPTGYGFFVLMLAGLLLAVNYSNNLVYALVYLLLSLALVSSGMTFFNLAGISAGSWVVEPVFVGQALDYSVSVTRNTSGRCYGLFLSNEAHNSDVLPTLIAQQSGANLTYVTTPEKRGRFQCRDIDLCSTWPLGMFKASKRLPTPPELIVWPKTASTKELPENPQGNQAHKLSEAETITGMRKYVAGDPQSRIDWKALARRDVLLTKTFDGAEGDPALLLEWNQLDSEDESRLSQLCRWVLDAESEGRDYALLLPTLMIDPGRGLAQKTRCLRALALYGEKEAVA